MNAKLIIEGKEFEIEILDPELEKLIKPKNKTGYERVGEGEHYYFSVDDGTADYETDYLHEVDDETYESANYYSDKTVAENNARAEKLMRQLRRFAVEHREKNLVWPKDIDYNFSIVYNYKDKQLAYLGSYSKQQFGNIYFETANAAQLAIETFHDELIWYFTEYKDSL